MRLAHLFLVHNHPEQLERLIKKMIHSQSDIYIHVDAKSDLQPFEYLKSLPHVFFIQDRKSVGWGNYSMVDATLCSMKEILEAPVEYSHINLLSGQDYLLKKIEAIESFFFENPGKSYIQYFSVRQDWKEAQDRFTKYNLGDLRIPFKYVLQNLINTWLPKRKIPNQLEPYGSSQWLTITPAAVRYVLNYIQQYPKVCRFFKYTWAADELFFQTILLNSPLKGSIVNDNKRYIKFENNALNPKILNMTDADALLDSDKFFARKFSIQEDYHILDLLDTHLNL